MNRTLLCSACVLAAALGVGGCTGARLTIEVSVYTGPLVEAPRGLLGAAVGLLKSMQLTAETARTCAALCNEQKEEFGKLADLFKGIFENKDIEYNEDLVPGTANARLTQKQLVLCARLLACADAAAHTATQRGMQDSVSGFLGNKEVQRFATAIDEGSRILRDRVNAVLFAYAGTNRTKSDIDAIVNAVPLELRDTMRAQLELPTDRVGYSLGKISGIMASQSPGNLVEARRDLFISGFIDRLYDRRYWAQINEVHVEGSGETQYLLYKDEIGNWHLKSAEIDPTKIIYAIQSVATAAINIAAAAGGVPIKLDMPAALADAGIYSKSLEDIVPIPQALVDRISEEREIASKTDAVIEKLRAQLAGIASKAREENWEAERIRSAVTLAIEAAQNDL